MIISTADLYDERGPELASVSVQFRDFGAVTSFSGPARTIRCSADNALIKAMLATPGRGAVLVVDGGGRSNGPHGGHHCPVGRGQWLVRGDHLRRHPRQ